MRFDLALWSSCRLFSGLALACAAILLALSAPPAWSQSTATGTVSGQVLDQTKAIIAGAQIKLTDLTTGASLTVTSNEAGRYSLLNVPPATYDISISKTGFSLFKVDAQHVEVGQVLTINAVLEVGSTTTTVEVAATAGAELQVPTPPSARRSRDRL